MIIIVITFESKRICMLYRLYFSLNLHWIYFMIYQKEIELGYSSLIVTKLVITNMLICWALATRWDGYILWEWCKCGGMTIYLLYVELFNSLFYDFFWQSWFCLLACRTVQRKLESFMNCTVLYELKTK